MLVKPPLEKLLPKVENRYTLAILVAKRARQLVDGALPLMHSDSPNLVTVASEELASNRVSCVRGQVNPYIPMRPEIEAARMAAKQAAAQANMADAVKDELDRVGSMIEDPMDASDVSLLSEMLMKGTDEAESDDDTPDLADNEEAPGEDSQDENGGVAEKDLFDEEDVIKTDEQEDED